MKPVSIKELIGAFEIANDKLVQYYSKKTGGIISFTEEYLVDEDLTEEDLNDHPDWEKGILKESIEIRDNFEDYIELPSRYEINEYDIMCDYAESLSDNHIIE